MKEDVRIVLRHSPDKRNVNRKGFANFSCSIFPAPLPNGIESGGAESCEETAPGGDKLSVLVLIPLDLERERDGARKRSRINWINEKFLSLLLSPLRAVGTLKPREPRNFLKSRSSKFRPNHGACCCHKSSWLLRQVDSAPPSSRDSSCITRRSEGDARIISNWRIVCCQFYAAFFLLSWVMGISASLSTELKPGLALPMTWSFNNF